MPKDIVVIGASAGGIEALRVLAGRLPADLPASLFIVLHTSPEAPSMLADILGRSGKLRAVTPEDGERIRPGTIYVGPPDRHLLVEPNRVRVTRGPKENRFRPAIDSLFRSAAQTYGPRVVGVILTGYLDDGTAGLWTVKQLGGTAVVQDPADALVPFMPLNAVTHVKVDYCLPLEEIAPLLVRLTTEAAEEEGAFQVPKEVEIEVNIAKEQKALDAGVLQLGEPSNYACPDVTECCCK
jgi:two-component system chemotaxis response regulator CheB